MTTAQVAATGKFQFFLPIAKVDKEKRTVSGYASTPALDSDGEMVSLKAVKSALPSYMEYGNIREMHKLSAVGTTTEANIDEKGLYITAKIVDDVAWKKCQEGVYRGFSIGGSKLLKSGNIITKIDMTEISVVDRPANPEAKFDCVKMVKEGETPAAILVKVEKTPMVKAVSKMAKAVKTLAKAGDGFSSPSKPGPASLESPALAKDGKEPYGDVSYADPGHQADGQKRYPVDTPEHVRAAWSYIHKKKNAAKYSPENLSSIKSTITSAWKKHVDKAGPPAAVDKVAKVKKVKYSERMAKAFSELETMDLGRVVVPAPEPEQQTFLTLGKVATGDLSVDPPAEAPDFMTLPTRKLKKGMGAASSLTYAFGSIRDAQRSLMLEGRDEKDGKDQGLAKRLGSIAKELAGVIGDKALHEGDEAVTMTDVDDRWVNQSLGKKGKDMSKVQDMIKSAVVEALFGTSTSAEALAKGEKPDMKNCLKGVKDGMKKARKARESAMEDLEKAHGMCKANFLAKAAKKDKDEKEPEFDAGECMKAISSAFASLQKAATLEKSAKDFLAKAEGMAGTSPTSGTADYIVPAGVKALAQSTLMEGGSPPLYESDKVYPGKGVGVGDLAKFAKDGKVSVEVAELLAKNALLEGHVEALGNLPRGGRRPHMFNLTKVNGDFANDTERREASQTIFEGVDVSAIGSGNEELHKAASARAIGNLILAPKMGRSIFDPSFRGSAGVKMTQ